MLRTLAWVCRRCCGTCAPSFWSSRRRTRSSSRCVRCASAPVWTPRWGHVSGAGAHNYRACQVPSSTRASEPKAHAQVQDACEAAQHPVCTPRVLSGGSAPSVRTKFGPCGLRRRSPPPGAAAGNPDALSPCPSSSLRACVRRWTPPALATLRPAEAATRLTSFGTCGGRCRRSRRSSPPRSSGNSPAAAAHGCARGPL